MRTILPLITTLAVTFASLVSAPAFAAESTPDPAPELVAQEQTEQLQPAQEQTEEIQPAQEQSAQPLVTPKISFIGSAAVKRTITAKVSMDLPEGLKVTSEQFEWKVDDRIVGREAAYIPKSADAGKRLTVTYTATWDANGEFAAGSASTSRQTVPVRKTPTVKVSVEVSGSARVGQTMKAKGNVTLPKGMKPSAVSYAWYRGDKKVGSGSSYKVKAGDRGEKLKATYSVEWLRNATYSDGSKSISKWTKRVALAKPNIKAKVTISGSAKVGKKLTAKGTASFPKGVKRSSQKYTWYVGGKKVATGKTYRVKTTDRGKALRVTYSVKSKATGKYGAGSAAVSSRRTINRKKYVCNFTGAAAAAPKVGDEQTYCRQVDREQSAPNKKLDKRIKEQATKTLKSKNGTTVKQVRFASAFKRSTYVTSNYGWRMHPILGCRKLHDGTDFGAACGTTQYATKRGTVFATGSNKISGNYVVIDHGKINGKAWMTKHAHLSSSRVKKGQKVTTQTAVGYTGTTGRSTGCHLHLGLYRNGQTVNVLKYMG